MVDDIEQLLSGLDRRPGATGADIAGLEQELGTSLPDDYRHFLQHSDGAEGFIGKAAYVMLWSTNEIAQLNQSYEVELYAPGLLIFGSSGGGEAYGFDRRAGGCSVVQIPFVGMAWDLAIPMGGSFNEFIRLLNEPA